MCATPVGRDKSYSLPHYWLDIRLDRYDVPVSVFTDKRGSRIDVSVPQGWLCL